MENSVQQSFMFDYKQIIIDEIALDGLAGIGIDLLWKRVEKRISACITDKMKKRFWNFIINAKCISFYRQPVPVPHIEILDRFMIVDEETGQLKDPDDYLDGPYEYCPVDDDHGSCEHYKTRLLIPHCQLETMPYETIVADYGKTLVMVASLEERWRALAPHMPITYLSQLTPVHYCILELVGRGRDNGQTTVGKTNLTKIVKEPKLLFYNRKHLQKLDLVRVQCITLNTSGKGTKSLFLTLKRFYKPAILTMPKVGKLHNLIEYLLKKPGYTEETEVIIKKGLISNQYCKRLRKTINNFKFGEKFVQVEDNPNKKRKRKNQLIKKKVIILTSMSDVSSDSEEETAETTLKCQYNVSVNIIRQAYERFLDAGLRGLTQIELAELLGIEFYMSRTICRIFKLRNIIREFLEDKGKQRTARYIAIAATSEMDVKFAEEKKKFLEYINDTQTKLNENDNETPSTAPDTPEVPSKKMKLMNDNTEPINALIDTKNIEDKVTEVKVLDGLENVVSGSLLLSKKNPTLRQLRFANGLLKVTREKKCVSGYQTLSSLVAREINQPPMDTKSLKLFVQKLVTDGQLKIFKLKWPGMQQNYTVLICAPNIKRTDPVIKAQYKEVCIRAYSKKKKVKAEASEKKNINLVGRPLQQDGYPCYMKLQKLHEFVTNFVYFNDTKDENEFPQGFTSVVNIIPEVTVRFGIGSLSGKSIADISHLRLNDFLDKKLRDVPQELYTTLLQSKHLQNSIRANLKILATLGLVQIIHQPLVQVAITNSNLLNFLFYVNRNAKIVDTRGVWPRNNVDVKSLEKSFYFETFNDVKRYWNEVFEISMNTDIMLTQRDYKKILPPIRSQDEVLTFDNGERHGDGMGPCGFDSCIFMERSRLWRRHYIKYKTKPTINKKVVKIPKIERIKKQKTVKPKSSHIQKHTKGEIIKRRHRKRKADLMVKWNKWEDRMLMMCKAAITVMSPMSQPGCLQIRNMVAKDILSINDPKKHATLCHKRALNLESNVILSHEKEAILSELRRRRNVMQKYEGLLKKLKFQCATNMTKCFNDARLRMLELVWIINQIASSKIFDQKVPCVALNYEDFHKNYVICLSSANKSYNTYRTLDNDIEIDTIREGIIITVMLSHNNIPTADTARRIYSILSHYPEASLRIALEQLRKCGVISAREKSLNNHVHKLKLQDAVQTSYKISALYQRRWMNSRLNTEFIEELANVIFKEIPLHGIKGAAGLNCLFCELQSCDMLEIVSATVPTIRASSSSSIQEEQLNVMDVEMKYELKSGTLGWNNKTNAKLFCELYENLQIDNSFQSLSRNAVYCQQISNATNTQEADNIISSLKEKEDNGSTFNELKEHCGFNDEELIRQLTQLESDGILKRVGYYENRIVLTEFIKPWSLKIKQQYIIPTPWMTLDGNVRYDIFLKWAGVIMNKVYESPGSSVAYLSDNCEILTTRSVQDICTFLEKCECIKINNMKIPVPDLFSDDDDYIIELGDFNEYDSPENIIVFPVKDSLTKYAYIRNKVIDNDHK